MHAVSASFFFGAPVVALVSWNPWWLIPFFVSGVVGSAGHYLFDDGRVDARETTSAPEVPPYVLLMFWMLLRGQWWDEVARAQQAVREAQQGPTATPKR